MYNLLKEKYEQVHLLIISQAIFTNKILYPIDGLFKKQKYGGVFVSLEAIGLLSEAEERARRMKAEAAAAAPPPSLCKAPPKIKIPKSVNFVGQNVFFGCDLLSLYVQKGTNQNGWDQYWAKKAPGADGEYHTVEIYE